MNRDTLPTPRHLASRQHVGGLSLVELLVSMGLGLLLVTVFAAVYFSSKGGQRRAEQLSDVQSSVRTAFEYITSDARSVGMAGCQSRRSSGAASNLNATDLRTNYAVAVEGYNAATTPSYPQTTANSAAGNWASNTATGGIAVLPFGTLGNVAIALGSDVLVLRTTVGRPLRLTAAANSATNAFQVQVEPTTGSGFCANGTTAKISGFCTNSHALIANCVNSRVFQVSSAASGTSSSTLNISNATAGLGSDPTYLQASTEVFPLQTIVYYVRPSLSGGGQSLYRRIFDGDDGTSNAGEEQELIRNVENMQVTYGVDTATSNADGTPDLTVDSYVTANAVTEWARVVAVRVSLLVRARDPVGAEMSTAASGVVNGVTVNYPSTGAQYDRRVFTTTIALRNRAAF